MKPHNGRKTQDSLGPVLWYGRSRLEGLIAPVTVSTYDDRNKSPEGVVMTGSIPLISQKILERESWIACHYSSLFIKCTHFLLKWEKYASLRGQLLPLRSYDLLVAVVIESYGSMAMTLESHGSRAKQPQLLSLGSYDLQWRHGH